MMPASNASAQIRDQGGWPLSCRAIACRTILKMQAAILKKMGRKLSSSPYLGSLLQVYLAAIEGERIYQACLSTDHASSTAHRRSTRLEEFGALVREDDPVDGRCTDLKLADPTKKALEEAIDILIGHCLNLGAEISAFDLGDPLIPKSRIRCHISTSEDASGMTVLRGKVIAGGRIALPADIRRSLGLQNGDTVLFELNGEEVRIRPARFALRRAQERLRAFAPKEGLVSEALIAERRAEAARD
jgi:AbrB family looped-hinge helix DNA binding protein